MDAPRVLQFLPLHLPVGADFAVLGPVGALPPARTCVVYDIAWDAHVVHPDCRVKIRAQQMDWFWARLGVPGKNAIMHDHRFYAVDNNTPVFTPRRLLYNSSYDHRVRGRPLSGLRSL